METISIKRDYIKIIDSRRGDVSTGGNQMWFGQDIKANMVKQGCGLISAVDLCLYKNNVDLIEAPGYIKEMNRFLRMNKLARFSMAVGAGILPSQLCRYINKSLIIMKATWNGRNGHQDMLEKMQAMLEQDIPVIWGLYRFGKKLNLYTYNNITRKYELATQVNSHYVNALAIVHATGGKTMIKVSSWGRILYIDYDEYLQYVGTSFISEYCSNIIVINPL